MVSLENLSLGSEDKVDTVGFPWEGRSETTALYIVNRLCACTRSVFLRAIIPLFDFTRNGRDAASNIAGDETFSAP